MRIAYYARKSNERNKNDSIENQLAIIDRHITSQRDLFGADIIRFIDDGFSGMNIDRDAFEELLAKVRMREIDVIAVKDLSRLGRNYLDVIKLTDSIFPFMGVRLIAVSDGYDSKHKTDLPMDLMVSLKTILNEFYVIDSSDKLRKAFAHRIRNGSYYGNIPYGYFLSTERKPVINKKEAKIIKEIFNSRLEGKTTLEIARELNSRNIPPKRSKEWTAQAILRVLKNTEYFGEKVWHKKVTDIKTKCSRSADEHEKYIDENALPPIIERDIFDKVQLTLEKRTKPYVEEYHIMARKLFCGHCMKTLRRNKNFSCSNSSLTGATPCFEGTLKRDVLYPEVLSKIKGYISKEITSTQKRFSYSDRKRLDAIITKLNEKRADVFEKFMDGEITEKEFIKRKNEVNVKLDEINKQLDEHRKRQAMCMKMHNNERPIDTLKRLCKADELTKEHMQFVEIITVYDVDNYDIVLYPDSPLAVLCKNISIYEDI